MCRGGEESNKGRAGNAEGIEVQIPDGERGGAYYVSNSFKLPILKARNLHNLK